MHHSINLNESIKASDSFKIETEIDAIIYRQEFELHRKNYLKSKNESELIFTFIFLQIYVECFLHQNMRRIIQLEFKPPRDAIYMEWLACEARFIPAKIDNFVILFWNPIPEDPQKLLESIKDNFKKTSYIRNQFVHGHKVSAWSDSEGSSGFSPAKLLLTDEQLAMSVTKVNELGVAWNHLLDKTLLQCKALREVESFKFISL